ncbi:hypothetical protein [Paenibacillus turpanensis]|uniref:hypothetical protein n=1 Tax=Paenibacillus turpanensis TaxID=2689078 RepID=UPI0014092BAC|nr:hypothetical protein [Paenibacillus turpanensis]
MNRIRLNLSKRISLLTMLIGILLIVVGILQVIPETGLLGYVWLVGAFGVTIFHGINVCTKSAAAFAYVDKLSRSRTKVRGLAK